ncbi:MAG: MATE family efflux transporter [Opitutales bacterium]|nr:MATE family efflux transporter [Opitutales bacterium]
MNLFLKELKTTIVLAFPIIVGFLGQGLFMLVDTFMIGQLLGERALASATLANSLFWLPMMICIGLSMGLPVFVAQLRGRESMRHDFVAARERVAAGEASILRHSLLVQIVASCFFVALLFLFVHASLFDKLGQPHEVSAIAESYTLILALSLPAGTVFVAVKSYRDATKKQWRGMFWTLIGIALNIFFNYVLMTGALFFPEMGLNGAAAGTLISRTISLAGIVFHGDFSLRLREKFNFKETFRILKFGVPCSAQGIFEGGFFMLSPFFMGWIGESSIAANAIAITIVSFVYMVPAGLAQAMSIRVGEAFGARQLQKIFNIAAGLLALTFVLMILNGSAVILFCREIAAVFNLTPEGTQLAAGFLMISGFSSLFDGFQCVSSGVMRGMGDVKIISYATFVAYWPLAVGFGLFLAFPLGFDGNGIWLGLAGALFVLSIFFTGRWISQLQKQKRAGIAFPS